MNGENPLKGLLGQFMNKGDKEWPKVEPKRREPDTVPERADGEKYGFEVNSVINQSNLDIAQGMTEDTPRGDSALEYSSKSLANAGNWIPLKSEGLPPVANDDILELTEKDRMDEAA